MIQESILFVAGILSSISFCVTGFGPAIVFLLIWFASDGFDLLKKTSDMIDCQAIMACAILLMCILNTLYFRRKITNRCKVLFFIAFVCISGVIVGTEILIIIGKNVWLKRGFGIFFFCVFLLQMLYVEDDSNAVEQYKLETLFDICSIGIANFTRGILSGLIGAGGPPVMILTLLRNYEKEEHIIITSTTTVFTLTMKILYLQLKFNSYRDEYLVLYLAPLGGVLVGFLIGINLRECVNQKQFRTFMQGLLFTSAVSMSTNGFPWSKWAMTASFVLTIIASLCNQNVELEEIEHHADNSTN